MAAIIKWLEHNFWYKVLALGLSVALWVYVVNTYNPLTTLDATAAVETRNVPEGLQPTTVSPSEMRVRLEGRAKALALFESEQMPVRVVADLADRPAGSHEVALVPDLPGGVRVIASPSLRATVRLEKVKSEEREVHVDPVGAAMEGFRCRAQTPKPETVMVRGPSSALTSVRTAVVRISVSGLETTTDFQPVVQPINDQGQRVPGVTVRPDRVHVRVIVEPVPERPLVVQPVFGEPPAGREIERFSVRPTTVVASGPIALLNSLTAIPTVRIDLAGVTRTTTRSVSLAPPSGVSIRGPASATVTVFLRPFAHRATPPEEPPERTEEGTEEGEGGGAPAGEGEAEEGPGGA